MDSEKDPNEVLSFLQEKGDRYAKMALIERKRQHDLEDAINFISQETDKYRDAAKKAAIDVMNLHVLAPNATYKRADGNNIGFQAEQMTSKVLKLQEANLNKLLQRKSEVIIQNKALKAEINHFRKLRMQTDTTHAKCEERLRDFKLRIELVLSEAAAVVEERERLVREKENLERLNAEEQRVFLEEYEALGTYIRKQTDALEEALLKERKSDRLGENAFAEINNNDANPNKSGISLDLEVDMARQVGHLATFMEREKAALATIQNTISDYEVKFEQLKKMTGTNSLEEVVSNYVAYEEEVFSLYNFIQAVNSDVDAVAEIESQLDQELQYMKEKQVNEDSQRRGVIDDLTVQLNGLRDAKYACDEQNKIYQELVSTVSKKVSSLFFKLQCDQMDSSKSLGSAGAGVSMMGGSKPSTSSGNRSENKIAVLIGQGVGEGNVLEAMGCIEQRAMDIISAYIQQKSDDNMSTGSTQLLKPMLTAVPSGGVSSAPNTLIALRRAGLPDSSEASPRLMDITELSAEDVAAAVEGAGIGVGNAGQSADACEVVDLQAFKEQLKRRISNHPNGSGIVSLKRSPMHGGRGDQRDRESTGPSVNQPK